MGITKTEMKTLLKAQQGELEAVLMYNALAKVVKSSKDAEVFRQLAKEEGNHAAVFHELTKSEVKPKNTKKIMIPLLYRIIGKKKLYPMIAKGEYDAYKNYEEVANRFDSVKSVQADEKRHGDTVKGLLE